MGLLGVGSYGWVFERGGGIVRCRELCMIIGVWKEGLSGVGNYR